MRSIAIVLFTLTISIWLTSAIAEPIGPSETEILLDLSESPTDEADVSNSAQNTDAFDESVPSEKIEETTMDDNAVEDDIPDALIDEYVTDTPEIAEIETIEAIIDEENENPGADLQMINGSTITIANGRGTMILPYGTTSSNQGGQFIYEWYSEKAALSFSPEAFPLLDPEFKNEMWIELFGIDKHSSRTVNGITFDYQSMMLEKTIKMTIYMFDVGNCTVVMSAAYNSAAQTTLEDMLSTVDIRICNGTAGNNISWTLGIDDILYVSGFGNMNSNTLCSSSDRKRVQKVVFDGDITSIGANSFAYFSALETVYIPNSVTKIGNYAFGGSSIETIVIPDSVSVIEGSAFANCAKLKSVHLPNTLAEIGSYLFSGCSALEHLDIPSTVSKIGTHAFKDCSMLSSIRIPNSVSELGSNLFDSCSSLKSVVLPENLTFLPNYIFYNCIALETVPIPEGVTCIGNNAFYGCKRLTYVDLPGEVTEIRDQAFKGCESLSAITMPDSVKSIGSGAFSLCTKLEKINLPEGLESIGYDAFSNTALRSAEIPDTVTTVGSGAFNRCEYLESVFLPASLDRLQYQTFSECVSLKSIALPENLTTIEFEAFYNCDALKKIVLPEAIVSIGESAFLNSGLESVTFSASLKKLGKNALSVKHELYAYFTGTMDDWFGMDRSYWNSNSGFQSAVFYINGEPWVDVVIPKSITRITRAFFSGITTIHSVTIHPGVIEIDTGAFNSAMSANLEYINYTGTPEQYLKSISGWRDTPLSFASAGIRFNNEDITELLIDDTMDIATIPIGAFMNTASLRSVSVSKGINSIGASAFANCIGLKNVDLGRNVQQIEYGAFRNCLNLESMTLSLPETISGKLGYIFGDTDPASLTEVTIPSGYLQSYFLVDAKSVRTVNIGDGVQYIDPAAFAGSNVDIRNFFSDDTEFTIGVSEKLALSSKISLLMPKYKSSSSVAAVSDAGIVTGKKTGTTKITVSANGAVCSFNVKVASAASKVTFTPNLINLLENKDLTLIPKITGTSYSCTWESSNPAIVSVDQNGRIHTNALGSADIILSTYNKKIGKCRVNVCTIPEDVEISAAETDVMKGKSITLTANVLPENAVPDVFWTTSDPAIATVSAGKITAKAVGQCLITAASCNGITAQCRLTVTAVPTKIVLSAKTADMALTPDKDQTIRLSAVVYPYDASQKVQWVSSSKKIAFADPDGTIHALGKGKVKIYAKSPNGIKAACTITVKPAPSSLKLSCPAVGVGMDTRIKVILPSGTYTPFRNFEIISGNEFASIDPDTGLLTAAAEGDAVVRCSVVGGAFADLKVPVQPAPQSIALNKTSVRLAPKGTLQLKVIPDRGVGTYTAQSSNEAVAKVSATGKITAVKKGTAAITVTCINAVPPISTECIVTVK